MNLGGMMGVTAEEQEEAAAIYYRGRLVLGSIQRRLVWGACQQYLRARGPTHMSPLPP
jgi:hypothetical protein